MIKLILFDFEETLARTYTDYDSIRNSVREFFNKQGLKEDLPFKPILADIQKASLILGKPEYYQEALSIIAQSELESSVKCEEIDGAKEAVEYFKHKKILVGIYSRTSVKAIEFCLKKLDFPPFDMVLGRESVASNKPSPEGINLALQKFGVRPNETLVIGDHIYDMMAAKAAGAIGVGVLGGISSSQDLIGQGAITTLPSVKELPKYYEKELINNNRHTGV